MGAYFGKVPRQRNDGSTGLIPAAARASTGEELSPEDLAVNLQAIETFATAVGGRDALLDTLAVADTAPECERLVNLLLDPRYSRLSLKRLCGMAGITVADLFAAYRKAMIVKAHIEATAIIAAKLPPVVEDVMARALETTTAMCPDCDGAGSWRDKACPRCQGTGAITRPPDLDRQKVALELGQLTQTKGGGLSIVQQNLTAASAASVSSGPLEQLQQAVGDLLFSPGRRRAAAPAGADAPVLDTPPAADPDSGGV